MEKQITETSFFDEINALASSVIEQYEYTSTYDDFYDGCHEMADGHQWVIYTYQAMQICSLPGSVTDTGEEWLEDIYPEGPYSHCETFADVCVRLAFAVMVQHLQTAVYEKLEEMEAAA